MGPIGRARDVFSEIYEKNVWGKGSGVGSEEAHTREYVAALKAFIAEHSIASVVDFGCGDWQFSRFIDWSGIEYDGFDVVGSVIDSNRAQFGGEHIRFHQLKDGTALPRADLLICKDVLQHLPNADVLRYIAVFKRLYKHILLTNDIAPEPGFNRDIDPGQWRALKLDHPPFKTGFEVLLTWDVNAYGCSWKKQTCYLRGAPEERLTSLALNDAALDDPLARARRGFLQRLRSGVRALLDHPWKRS